jgi:hypothetical protein
MNATRTKPQLREVIPREWRQELARERRDQRRTRERVRDLLMAVRLTQGLR